MPVNILTGISWWKQDENKMRTSYFLMNWWWYSS